MEPHDLGTYCAIVVTFRRPESLAVVLDSLASQTVRPEVVVVADNDPARSAEAVAADGHRSGLHVVYRPLEENTGPAGGWAEAADLAGRRADRGTWMLVLDDDDPLGHPELLQRLLAAAGDLDAPQRCGGIGLRGATLDRRRGRLTRPSGGEGVPTRVDYLASNGAPVYRWEALDEVGFFDRALFFGFEDLDQGLRLTDAGWNLWALSLPSLHVVADSAPSRLAWREYFKIRALVSICRRHLGPMALTATVVRSGILGGLRLAVHERDWRLVESRLVGALDGLRGRMGPNGRAPLVNAPKAALSPGARRFDLLFVSGVSVGGACRSTLELAAALHDRGHRVRVILGDRPPPGSPWGLALRLVTKLRSWPGGAALHRAFRRVTRGGRRGTYQAGPEVRTARFPENAHLAAMRVRRPEVVVANSLSRNALRLLHDDLRAREIPLVLYLRESQALKHLELWGIGPDAAIANSHHLADQARLAGLPCDVVPSAVDVRASATASSRATLLMVNPVPENRPDIALEIARARPDIHVALQESWPLEARWRGRLETEVAGLRNVELRTVTSSPAAVYRDAKLLLAPYATGRPRVVVEAQHNEIPCVALDQPGLREVVGDAGALVALDAPVDDWLEAIASAWDDPDHYARLRIRCRARSASSETTPARVAERFEEAIARLVLP